MFWFGMIFLEWFWCWLRLCFGVEIFGWLYCIFGVWCSWCFWLGSWICWLLWLLFFIWWFMLLWICFVWVWSGFWFLIFVLFLVCFFGIFVCWGWFFVCLWCFLLVLVWLVVFCFLWVFWLFCLLCEEVLVVGVMLVRFCFFIRCVSICFGWMFGRIMWSFGGFSCCFWWGIFGVFCFCCGWLISLRRGGFMCWVMLFWEILIFFFWILYSCSMGYGLVWWIGFRWRFLWI